MILNQSDYPQRQTLHNYYLLYNDSQYVQLDKFPIILDVTIFIVEKSIYISFNDAN